MTDERVASNGGVKEVTESVPKNNVPHVKVRVQAVRSWDEVARLVKEFVKVDTQADVRYRTASSRPITSEPKTAASVRLTMLAAQPRQLSRRFIKPITDEKGFLSDTLMSFYNQMSARELDIGAAYNRGIEIVSTWLREPQPKQEVQSENLWDTVEQTIDGMLKTYLLKTTQRPMLKQAAPLERVERYLQSMPASPEKDETTKTMREMRLLIELEDEEAEVYRTYYHNPTRYNNALHPMPELDVMGRYFVNLLIYARLRGYGLRGLFEHGMEKHYRLEHTQNPITDSSPVDDENTSSLVKGITVHPGRTKGVLVFVKKEISEDGQVNISKIPSLEPYKKDKVKVILAIELPNFNMDDAIINGISEGTIAGIVAPGGMTGHLPIKLREIAAGKYGDPIAIPSLFGVNDVNMEKLAEHEGRTVLLEVGQQVGTLTLPFFSKFFRYTLEG